MRNCESVSEVKYATRTSLHSFHEKFKIQAIFSKMCIRHEIDFVNNIKAIMHIISYNIY